MSYLKFFTIFAFTLSLGACVSLSTIKTMQVMSGFDPLEADIANMVFGVEATPKLKTQPETSKFTMTVQLAGDGPSIHRFALEQVHANKLTLTNVPRRNGKVLSLFGFSKDAKRDLVAFQTLLRDMKAKDTKGASLSIGVVPDFCKTEPIDHARESFSVYMARATDNELLPLVENMTLKDLLKEAKRKDIRDC